MVIKRSLSKEDILISGSILAMVLISASQCILSPPETYVRKNSPRIIHLDPHQIVFMAVTRSQASTLLVFSDPHELYQWHEFRDVSGFRRIRIYDGSLSESGDKTIATPIAVNYMGCTADEAVEIVKNALSIQ